MHFIKIIIMLYWKNTKTREKINSLYRKLCIKVTHWIKSYNYSSVQKKQENEYCNCRFLSCEWQFLSKLLCGGFVFPGFVVHITETFNDYLNEMYFFHNLLYLERDAVMAGAFISSRTSWTLGEHFVKVSTENCNSSRNEAVTFAVYYYQSINSRNRMQPPVRGGVVTKSLQLLVWAGTGFYIFAPFTGIL